MEIISFILNIVQAIVSIISWPFKKIRAIMKVKNVKIKQEAKHLQDVKGMSVNLGNGEKVQLKDIDVEQKAETMRNTTGMEIKATGKQEAELQNIEIKSPIGSVKISKGVTINKQVDK
ncbi:MAG: hypothetical protein Q8R13_00165 [bacterium]|nr:hypothetical protein [bacterium]MDZ4296565.1 hypothetical protein [Patescibacteria group bacterium]